MHDKKPKRIKVFTDDEIKDDLEKYRMMAKELGASGATVIPAEKVHVDKRVRIKCTIPKCPQYGGSAHCPPHTMEPDKMSELVQAFKYALLVKLEIQSSVVVGGDFFMRDKDGKLVPKKAGEEFLKTLRRLSDIVTEIESQAFYDGHYLATSFSSGSCHLNYCNFKECQVLKGQPCRFPLRARPSMEACSMDVFRMATEAGWDIYPIGMDCNPALVPQATLVGLVLIE